MYNKRSKAHCYLCGNELNNSNRCDAHIMPRFLWKEYMGVGNNRQDMLLIKNDSAKILKTYGITDDNILCRRCDDEVLGKYENNFKKVWTRVFVNGELYPVKKDGKLVGWVKRINGYEDIVNVKVFLLCCLWRASLSNLNDYSIKLSLRRENAIRNELIRKNHDNLIHSYHTICYKFEDDVMDFVLPPYLTRKNAIKTNMCYVHLPHGYLFAIRPGAGDNGKRMQIHEFGAEREYFFIGNFGRFEGSKTELKMFKKVLPNLQNMYDSDKDRLKTNLLRGYDLSADDINKTLQR